MLIVLHICSLLILYASGYTNLGNNDTIISNNQSRDIYYMTSLGKFDF